MLLDRTVVAWMERLCTMLFVVCAEADKLGGETSDFTRGRVAGRIPGVASTHRHSYVLGCVVTW
jgi:hypothetical protein